MMLEEAIKTINEGLTDLFGKYPGVKIYGLTQAMTRKVGTETQVIPALVDREGEGKWVGVDDTAPLIIYHKNLSPVQVVPRPLSGYGDETDSVNVYSLGLIAYFDRSRISLTADEVQRLIQVNVPVLIKFREFKSVRITVNNIILNSQQVYQAEFQNGKVIDPKSSMIQLSYQIESRFSKACFATCP